MHTIGELILKSATFLESKQIETPRLDAEILLAHILGCDRLRLYMDWGKPMVELEVAAYRDLIRRRGSGREPVSRIVGSCDFHGRDFPVHPNAFVPRPETEGLVELALELLETRSVFQDIKPIVFDIGTGSGCIIITLALEHSPGVYMASELVPETLEVARANARHFKVDQRIDIRPGRNFADYEGPVHLLVSNPPYISKEELATLPPEVSRHDPGAALDGGESGLEVFDTILIDAKKRLVPGGLMVFEMGEDQEDAILERFKQQSDWLIHGEMKRDLAGKPRYFMAERRG